MEEYGLRQFKWSLYTTYFLCGHALVVFGSVMPQIIEHYHLSYTEGGFFVFLGTGGFLLGVVFSSFLTKHYAYKKVISVASVFLAIVQCLMVLVPPIGVVYLLNLLNGVLLSILQIIIATIIMDVFVGKRAVMMSRTEVSFGLGALCMPIISSILIAIAEWRYSFLVPSILGILVASIWQSVSVPLIDRERIEYLEAQNAPPRIMTSQLKWILLCLFLLMIFIYDGIETSLNNFLPSIFINYSKVGVSYATLSVSIFWLAMVIGRALTGWIVKKVTYHRFLLWSIVGTICFFGCFTLWRSIIICYAILFLIGLTMSGIYSVTMVFANHTFPGMTGFVTSLVTGFAGIGSAVFPAFFGYTMDHTNTFASLWILTSYACLFLLLLLVLISLLFRKKESKWKELQLQNNSE
ncbi:MFS transporter [Bacillus sp. SAJ1]|nr:MFS transporter [Bacillus sp. SAJ1]